mgnify:CR=1 FL=1
MAGGVTELFTRVPFVVRRLGTLDYAASLEVQRQLVEARRSHAIPDTLVFVEHPPVITLGARNKVGGDHIVASPGELAAAQVTVHDARPESAAADVTNERRHSAEAG